MQWDDGPNAGFSTPDARPWLPIAADYRTRNVAAQESDPGSMLNFYRALAALRRAEPALNRGDYEEVDLGVDDVLAYRRTRVGSDGFLVVLNLGGAAHHLDLRSAVSGRTFTTELSTYPARAGRDDAGAFPLSGNEGILLRLLD